MDLNAGDVSKILEWLTSRDLHFGQSAFLSLQKMLASKDVDVPMEVIGRETILIDILTGVIHKFTEGDLLLSMFALDRTALIHGKDFASVKFTYDDLKSLYESQVPSPEVRVIAHIGEDHFVLIKRVTDTQVIYEETGKGANGEEVTADKEGFLKVWLAKDNTGYLMVSEEQASAAKKLTDKDAMKIRGAFFFVFIFLAASFVLSVASMIVSTFSPTWGKILGYAALVAGIVGIAASIGQFVVSGLKMVFSSIAQNGFLSTIQQGFVYLGKVLVSSVKAIGRFVMKGFDLLKGCFTGGLGSFGAGIASMKNFLIMPAQEILKDGVVIGHKFTVAQVMARQLVAAGLSIGVSKGLEGLGLSPELTRLAGAFVGGGFLGVGSATSSFMRSGLQMAVLQGVSEMAVHIGLSPPIASALSLVASTGLTSFFDGNFGLKAFTEIIPTVAQQFTMGGIELLGRSLGIDPRITSLLSIPVTVAVGAGVARFVNGPGYVVGYDAEGNKVRVPDTRSLLKYVSDSVFSSQTLGGMISIGANIALDSIGLPPLASELVNGFMAGLGGTDLGKSIISKIDEGLGKFSGWVANSLEPVVEFGAKALGGAAQVTADGFRNAIGAFSSIFSSETRENIYQDLAGLRSGTVTADGDIWTWQSGDSRVDYNVATGRIGESFGVGGTARIEGLGQSASGSFVYRQLTYENVMQDGILTQTYEDGTLKKYIYKMDSGYQMTVSALSSSAKSGITSDGSIENGTVSIDIPGPGPDPQNPENNPTDYAAYTFSILNGQVQKSKVEVKPGTGSGSQTTDSDKSLYVLANGIGNDGYSAPDYILNLENDLQSQSQGQIVKDEDTLAIPLYFPWTKNGVLNKSIDVVRVILEGQLPAVHLTHALRSIAYLLERFVADGNRPVVAMGYSGGFAPLIEGLVSTPYNADVAGIVGLGAATVSLPKDTIDTVLKIVQKVSDSVIDGLEFLLGKLTIVGQKVAEFINFVQEKAFDKIMEILQGALSVIQKVPISPLPNVAGLTSASFFVNLWGSKDILAETGIGGYRSDLVGFYPGDERKTLFNIEILGATHFDYMRETNGSAWNVTVADFVTRLMIASQSKEELSAFLAAPPPDLGAVIALEGGAYVVRLPGWEQHV